MGTLVVSEEGQAEINPASRRIFVRGKGLNPRRAEGALNAKLEEMSHWRIGAEAHCQYTGIQETGSRSWLGQARRVGGWEGWPSLDIVVTARQVSIARGVQGSAELPGAAAQIHHGPGRSRGHRH